MFQRASKDSSAGKLNNGHQFVVLVRLTTMMVKTVSLAVVTRRKKNVLSLQLVRVTSGSSNKSDYAKNRNKNVLRVSG